MAKDGDGSEVRSVEARRYRCAIDPPIGYAKGFIAVRESAVARVVTADGTVGWGECYAPAAAAAAAIEALAPHLLGASVFARAAVGQAMERGWGAAFPDPATAAARSALLLAALDAAGKIAGLPARALLGGAAQPAIRTYASALWFQPEADPTAHYADAVRAARQQGFGAVKAKIGIDAAADGVAMARARQGDSAMTLMADANQAHDPVAAAEAAAAAADAGFAWLEEPLPPDRLDDYAVLRMRAGLPIAGGETIRCRREARSWIAAEAIDIVQPDACLAGGLDDAVALSLAANDAGFVVAPHCYGLGLGLAASLHWAAAFAGAADEPVWIEIDTSPNPARDALLAGCAWFGEGGASVRVPDDPGLGVDLDRIEGFRVA